MNIAQMICKTMVIKVTFKLKTVDLLKYMVFQKTVMVAMIQVTQKATKEMIMLKEMIR